MRELVQIQRVAKSELFEEFARLDRAKMGSLAAPQISLEKLTKRVAENVITGADVPVPECGSCGACCSIPLMVNVRRTDDIDPADVWEVLLDGAPFEVVADVFLKRSGETGRCIRLAGDVGESVSCGIYPKRPATCREFEAGSDRCHAYRRMAGIENPLTDAESAAAEMLLANAADNEKIVQAAIVLDRATYYTRLTEAELEQGKNPIELTVKVVAALLDGSERELFAYDPSKEAWFESDFVGLSLDRAEQMINSRRAENI